MFTVLVDLQVRPDRLAAFVEGIRANARASLRDEPGCLRFDVHQRVDDSNQSVTSEIYTDERAFYEAHRSTPHYAAWRMIAARCVVPGGHVNTFCTPLFPEDVPEGTTVPR